MKNFLTNDIIFLVNSDKFNTFHYNIFIQKSELQPVKGYTVDIDRKKYSNNLLSTIGEYLERERLVNYNRIRNIELDTIDLLSGRSKKIETKKIISTGEFVDSCGMASHTESEELIINCFREFFERQSFILNYLGKLGGEKIIIESGDKYDHYIKEFTDHVSYYDISLHHSIKVIIAIADGEYNVAVGLGTDTELASAIEKSQCEILQYFSNSYIKGNRIKIEANSTDFYHTYFESLDSDKLLTKFRYLENKPKIKFGIKSDLQLNIPLIRKICNDIGMHPEFVCLFANRGVNRLKVGKIFDRNWFPHMFPYKYKEQQYKFIEKKFGIELDRNIKFLPFA